MQCVAEGEGQPFTWVSERVRSVTVKQGKLAVVGRARRIVKSFRSVQTYTVTMWEEESLWFGMLFTILDRFDRKLFSEEGPVELVIHLKSPSAWIAC